jgi:uncharacterized membrane protein YidH (DUF202 family)
MSDRRPDRVSIVVGVAVTLLGILLLLDQAGALDLQFDYAAPAVLATVGVVLVALGLAGEGAPRDGGGA